MTHLETFLDCLKGLPNDLQRTFTLMNDLDKKSGRLKRKLNHDEEELLRCANHKQAKGTGGAKVSTGAVPGTHVTVPTLQQLKSVRHKQWQLYNYANEKIALADQSAAMIKSFVTRLDEDLKKMEQILGPDVPPEPVFEPTPRRKTNDRSKHNKSESFTSPAPSFASRHKSSPYGNASSRSGSNGEPVYCHCRQVSFGEMVGCDGSECRFEWFHLACVGLKKPPKGKWYCEDCRS